MRHKRRDPHPNKECERGGYQYAHDVGGHKLFERLPGSLDKRFNIGKPAIAVVRVGQEVLRGQLIAKPDGLFSLPIHAPATGVVAAIEPMPSDSGEMEMCIIIRVYEADSQEVQVRSPHDLENLRGRELALVMQEVGVAGKGGATFPTHAKLIPPEGKVIDTLIVNGAECEPFLTCDHRIMVERAEDIMAGIKYARRVCGAPRAIIVPRPR